MNRNIKETLKEFISEICLYVELILAAFLAIIIILLVMRLIRHGFLNVLAEDFELDYYLVRAMSLAVGVEFIKMLTTHTPNTIIEVLMFATARHLILDHSSAVETAIGIVTIGMLFGIRKFLMSAKEGEKPLSKEDI